MKSYLIAPEDGLLLTAFRDSRSLREAAELLVCDPAGLVRRVQRLSEQHGLLQKVENRWRLTARGLDLAAWSEASVLSQKSLLEGKSLLRIASTTWFMEEVLIPGITGRHALKGGLSLSVPDKGFEMVLIDGSADFAAVCHPPESPEIEHRRLTLEEWTVIAPASWHKFLGGKDPGRALIEQPFVRHAQMNPDIFLPGLEPRLRYADCTVDNLTAVRAAVRTGLGWSVVPRLLAARGIQQGELYEVRLPITVKDRHVCVWWLRNRQEAKRHATKVCQWIKACCLP